MRRETVRHETIRCVDTLAASAAEVTSDNVVGYQKIDLTGGKLNCIALQFQDVGATDAAISLAKITSSGVTAGVYDTMNTQAACIMTYNGDGYDYYYYISDAFDANENEVTAWADLDGVEIDVTKVIGTGFWLNVPEKVCSKGKLMISGEVSNTDQNVVNINEGLTLAGNPYPGALNLSKVIVEGLEPGVYDTMNTEAPCIMVYNGDGYDYYYYISDAFDANENEVTAWADLDGVAVVDDVATSGMAFWARSKTTGTLTFKK